MKWPSVFAVFSPFFLIFALVSSDSQPAAPEKAAPLYAKDTLQESHGKVVFASLIFRHGERTVISTYANDPYPPSIWKEGFGELSQVGKQHSYELGQWFQERYADSLLADGYLADEMIMESSNENRTIMSGLLVLAGAYPPRKKEAWDRDNLQWQPIPIHTISSNVDNMIGISAPCPRVIFEKELLANAPELTKLYSEYEETIQYIEKKSGNSLLSYNIYDIFEKLWLLYDILHTEEMNNLTLPLWTKQVYPEPLQMLGLVRFRVKSYSFQLKRLLSGPLLASVVSDLRRKRDHQSNYTAHYYSSHKITIPSFLALLGVSDDIVPPYCSTVMIELRQKENSYVVTVMYRNSSDAPPYLLEVPGCDKVCTLDQFLRVSDSLIPTDWNAECQVTIFTRLQYLDLYNLIIILFAILLIGIVILISLRTFIKKQRSLYNPF